MDRATADGRPRQGLARGPGGKALSPATIAVFHRCALITPPPTSRSYSLMAEP